MLYFAGYILACFLTVSLLGWALSVLHRRSTISSKGHVVKHPPSIRSHALISFSVILPFSALAFLLLTLSAMMIAPILTQEGRHLFVWEALFLPTSCFLLGYFYFKKVVGS